MMFRQPLQITKGRDLQFNLTPMIDVVFLLIIFFMLACQFIARENYQIIVPDDCPGAMIPEAQDRHITTISVYRQHHGDDSGETIVYTVHGQRITKPSTATFGNDLARLIREDVAEGKPAICLRADQDLAYGDVQDVLLAAAQTGIQEIQLAAFRDENPGRKPNRHP